MKKIAALDDKDVIESLIALSFMYIPVIISIFVPIWWIRLILVLATAGIVGYCCWLAWWKHPTIVHENECINAKVFGTEPLNCQRNYAPEYGDDLDFPNSK